MLTLPLPLLINFLIGLLSVGLFAAAAYLLYRVAQRWTHYGRYRRHYYANLTQGEPRSQNHVVDKEEPWRQAPIIAPLIAGTLLLLLTFGGRYFVQLAFPTSTEEPEKMRLGEPRELARDDGTKIHAELYGSVNAPVLVFTHGWGTNSTEWYYAKRHLADRFRLILWDLPGLGETAQPTDRNFSLERMASDLRIVLSLANGKPVILVGHSIGGMINLTFCRLYPALLGPQVRGLVQLDTSYTNPVKTTKNARFSLAIQKPVGEPLLHLMIGLSPLVRAMNWMSYQNGTAQIFNAQSSFAGSETRGQVDLVSRYQFESSPAVVARGTLGMFHWDATPVLSQLTVPVLIIVGKQDTTTLPSASEYMHRMIAKSELQIVDPSAHYGLLEQNQRYDAAIEKFAATHFESDRRAE